MQNLTRQHLKAEAHAAELRDRHRAAARESAAKDKQLDLARRTIERLSGERNIIEVRSAEHVCSSQSTASGEAGKSIRLHGSVLHVRCRSRLRALVCDTLMLHPSAIMLGTDRCFWHNPHCSEIAASRRARPGPHHPPFPAVAGRFGDRQGLCP